MSNTTTNNLGLAINLSEDTEFATYLAKNDENLSKIDAFAGKIYGKSGSFTILAGNWSDKTYTVSLVDLGENDCVICQPNGRANKTIADEAELFLDSVNGTNLTFSVSNVPSNDIELNYFITRGKA